MSSDELECTRVTTEEFLMNQPELQAVGEALDLVRNLKESLQVVITQAYVDRWEAAENDLTDELDYMREIVHITHMLPTHVETLQLQLQKALDALCANANAFQLALERRKA
jgi:hypothetical protein